MINKWMQIRHELGWHGVAGAVLLALGLVFSNTVLFPEEERVAEVREQMASLDQPDGPGSLDGSGSPSDEMRKFYDFFETDKEITDYLARIYSLAQAHDLRLREGDYKPARVSGERIIQYQITLPVTGGYGQIRGFAAGVLDAIPVLSLDMIRFERKQSRDPQVEAEVVFTLYYYVEQS